MKSLSVIVFVSLATLMSLSSPAHAFFGMFRRRSAPKPQLREESMSPQGPIGFNNDFQRRQNFFGSFGSFPNIPGLTGGLFPGNPFRPSWPSFPGSPQGFPGGQSPFPGGQSPFPGSQSPFPGNQGGFPGGASQFPGGQQQFQPTPNSMRPAEMRSEDSEPQLNTEEAESFFTLLAETDENKCISRLVCELGADPQGAGELGTTISEIIGSLTDFPEGSRVSEYNEVIKSGKNKGVSFCGAQFSACDEESYGLMKSSQAEQVAETDESS